MKLSLNYVMALTGILYFAGCTNEAEVEILEPARGAMLAAGEEVTVKIKSEADDVTVGDQKVSVGGGTKEVKVSPADGLGFITAEISGDPLIAVRSWHQGDYLSPSEWHDGTMLARIGTKTLSGKGETVASLIEELLENEELEAFVDDPLKLKIALITANVFIDSVSTPTVSLDLEINEDGLNLECRLEDVSIDYTAKATGLSSSGTAIYDWIEILAGVELADEKATLTDITSKHSAPNVTDSGGLPGNGVELVATLLNKEIPKAVGIAAQAAADIVVPHLLDGIKPMVGVDFDKPLEQETKIGAVSVGASSLDVSFETQIVAKTPQVAAEGTGVLSRTTAPFESDPAAMVVTVGSELVNHFAFALWDAGNFTDLTFTKSELENSGMGDLDFPYDHLKSATIRLLLPPLLEWRSDGPWLDLGGIETDISIDDADDSTAWTASHVPVNLVLEGQELKIVVDESRAVTIEKVGFDRMSSMADQDKVLKLMNSAVPGVVKRVFGELPNIAVGQIELTDLAGSPIDPVILKINTVTSATDHWVLDIALTR